MRAWLLPLLAAAVPAQAEIQPVPSRDDPHLGQPRASAVQESPYKLTGNKALRPASIRDDGSKMYIEWRADQLIPAVFALDPVGREEMVDGYMRGGTFTIDRLHDRLVFRIDDSKAEAARRTERSPR